MNDAIQRSKKMRSVSPAAFFCVIIAITFSVSFASSEIHSGPNPNTVLESLLDGNTRFADNLKQHPHQQPQRRIKTAQEGQKPIATILTCSDSRVPPEIIFDAGIGDIFVVRVAGNIADKIELGSIEYGIGHLGTTLIMVLGHSKCGAVTAAVNKAEVGGNIKNIIKSIEPAVEKARAENKGLGNDALVPKAIKANVWQVIDDILKNSAEVRKMVREAKVKIVGAIYDLESGKVTNLGVHSAQQLLLDKYDGIPHD
jgi:carbonic anhydrase